MLFTQLSLNTLKRLTYNMFLLLFNGNYSMETLVGVFSCKSIFFSISCLFFFSGSWKELLYCFDFCYIILGFFGGRLNFLQDWHQALAIR